MRTGHFAPRRAAILVAALCLAGWTPTVTAAPKAEDDKVRWLFQASSGVTAMRLGGIKDAFREELGFFNANGVPIEAEREYPANLQLGADVMVGGRSRWLVGIGSSYTWTHAYALYADSNGTLDVRSKVEMWTMVSVLHWSSLATRGWGAFGELRLGRAFATSDLSEEMVLAGVVNDAAKATSSSKANGRLFELHVGAVRSFGRNTISFGVGYRLCEIDVSGAVLSMTYGRLSR